MQNKSTQIKGEGEGPRYNSTLCGKEDKQQKTNNNNNEFSFS